MIEVSQLHYRYPQAKADAVRGLNFSVHSGEIFGFLGPSGAGKSTTQKVLIGLLKGYQGNVTLLGKDLSVWDASLYEHIGVSFEFPNHFLKLTALENLVYFSRLYSRGTQNPMHILEQVGLAADARQPVETFSKGMRNRLTVARALLHDPQVLFLDEPTSGLDPVNARMIKDMIREQQNLGKTIFLTTHNMNVAEELCDHVGLIVDGKIAMIDTPRQLKLQYGQPIVQVEVRSNGKLLKEEFALEGLGGNSQFLNLIRTQPVQTIHTQEATLEDVFIQVTGRRLL
ncbi:MAG: ATP-binding protein [Chloroflexi bacterium HGW-Chloroflexi-10]|nr:MAG: ATP-binding protein [Chloroflexi bacterium HGW-Chloroflexi-10]